MRFISISFIALFILVSLTMGAPVELDSDTGPKPFYDISEAPELFEKFIKDYNKSYKDEADKQSHYEAFLQSLESINKANSDRHQSATFDINEFADESEEEFSKRRGFSGY